MYTILQKKYFSSKMNEKHKNMNDCEKSVHMDYFTKDISCVKEFKKKKTKRKNVILCL